MTVATDRSVSMPREVLIDMYARMVRIRVFEERTAQLADAGQFPGGVHLSLGEEATYVGTIMAMNHGDYFTGNHRAHGHPLAAGTDLKLLMAELFGKATGLCKGKGGSMHLADFARGCLGESGIVGAAIPIAVGAGLSAQTRGSDQVAIAFFGDGAVNEGIFHESVNLAGAWKLPVVFVCENNFYSVDTRTADLTAGGIASKAPGYGIPGKAVDGQDVLAVYGAAQAAIARARAGDGPSLIESQTFRYDQHAHDLVTLPYGWDEERETWMTARDPIKLFGARLLSEGHATQHELDAIRSRIIDAVEEAVQFARDSPLPDPEEAFTDVYGPETDLDA